MNAVREDRHGHACPSQDHGSEVDGEGKREKKSVRDYRNVKASRPYTEMG